MQGILSITVDQMREVDRLMVEEFGVNIRMMMENASRNIARHTMSTLGPNKSVVVLCGKGNNGGDGLGAARHLINFGADVTCLITSKPHELTPDAMAQFNILKAIDAKVEHITTDNIQTAKNNINNSDFIIDALLGYNLQGKPREPIASLINLANDSQKPILAVDIPSGLSGDDAKASNPTIKANETITLALPKTGLLKDEAKPYVGELFVADLSVPREVYEKLNIEVPTLFEKSEIIKV